NCEKYYTVLKKIFGNKNNIPTQFIQLSTLNYNDKSKNAIFLNILLGLYGKSGIQPWVLSEPLTANCYVGIDVSRENKLNTAGVIQVVGKDGQILRSKSMTSPQSGEKINTETMREIFHEVTSSYKKAYGESLNHIVFHRDGISREEIEILKETANNLDIKFDYVEITKNISRRVATLSVEDKTWKTEIGAYFTRGDTAYMVTTNPFESLGMQSLLG
ncbi:MAG: Piwi domain-containing protein, partial [Peptostreptococcaceae bacterium]